ncbi:Nucleolysin TIA-1, partial [Folsomia candida]
DMKVNWAASSPITQSKPDTSSPHFLDLVGHTACLKIAKTDSDLLFPSSALSPPQFHAKVYLPANCCCPSGPAAGLLTSPLLRHPSGMLATMSALMLPTTASVAHMGATAPSHMPLLAVGPNTKHGLDGLKSPSGSKSEHYHIFVGDLSPEIETQALRDAFANFGEISFLLFPKGYGFVSFVKKTEAESAITAMNGQWLGNRSIRTNWATRKPPPPKAEGGGGRRERSTKVHQEEKKWVQRNGKRVEQVKSMDALSAFSLLSCYKSGAQRQAFHGPAYPLSAIFCSPDYILLHLVVLWRKFASTESTIAHSLFMCATAKSCMSEIIRRKGDEVAVIYNSTLDPIASERSKAQGLLRFDDDADITFVSGMLQPFSIVLVSRFTRRREGVVVVVGCGERTGVDKLGCRRESYQSLSDGREELGSGNWKEKAQWSVAGKSARAVGHIRLQLSVMIALFPPGRQVNRDSTKQKERTYAVCCVLQSLVYVSGGNSKQLTFDEVYNQSSPTNCTVYCGGITNGLSEELMQKTFAPFGQIQEIRVFKDKGYAFIRFGTKESATHAIVAVHNTEINGQTVKCSWGKEAGDPANVSNQVSNFGYGSIAAAGASQYPYAYGQQMGYWYPQGYPAAAQMQNQFLQGMQGYSTYGNFGYQQGAYMGNVGGMQGVTSWGQGLGCGSAATPQMTGAQNAAATAAVLQQPNAGGPLMAAAAAYPMQQFQV